MLSQLIHNDEVWNTHNITPGTKFMKKLSDAFKKAIKSGKFSKHLTNKKYQIIFSDSSIPGEGEHKIMMFIRLMIAKLIIKKTNKLTIFGDDADLIVLNFPFLHDIRIQKSVNKQIRDDIPELPKDVKYIYFIVHKFRDSLINNFRLESIDTNRFIYDYVFLSFLGGNDFVSHLSFLASNNKFKGRNKKYKKDGISHIIDYYNNIQNRNRKYILNTDFTINTEVFKTLINKMAWDEHYGMIQIYNSDFHQKDWGDDKNKTPIENDFSNFEHNHYMLESNPYHEQYKSEFKKIDYNLPYLQWKAQYNNYYFGTNDKKEIMNICKDYIKSLLFTLYYYLSGIPPSWRWSYEHRVSPLLSDIRVFLKDVKDINTLCKWKTSKPLTPLHQLYMVLPPTSMDILPKVYQKAMKKSPLNKYHYSSFVLDVTVGKKYWKSEPILPEINHKLIVKELNKLKLPTTNKNRNKLEHEPFVY